MLHVVNRTHIEGRSILVHDMINKWVVFIIHCTSLSFADEVFKTVLKLTGQHIIHA